MIELNDVQKAVVFLDSFEKLEYRRKTEILRLLSSPRELFSSASKLEKAFSKFAEGAFIRPIISAMKDGELVEEVVEDAVKSADGIVTVYDDEYPTELKNTPVPPLVLYYKGNVGLLENGLKRTAIVGSRKTLPSYLEQARQVSETLSFAGEIIVTGIAEGADTAAIKGAVDSKRLISVFAGGLDSVYPRSQINLANKIAENGLIVTEYPSGRAPKVYTYPVRNRIIAGLSRACLIVSGNSDGGARYTASYAVDYGREVMAFPYGIGVSSGELCNGLIKQGAMLVETAADVAALLGIESVERKKINLEGNEKTVYGAIVEGVTDVDRIVENTGLKPFEVNVALSMLELKRLVVKNGVEYDIIKR